MSGIGQIGRVGVQLGQEVQLRSAATARKPEVAATSSGVQGAAALQLITSVVGVVMHPQQVLDVSA